ncbi:apolipoprotein N-acyltransferase [Geomonas sp.]|uniref:apolipoprotein N-acyltransferase n=1 Tax=Geomonas sp. TaxID=2651584 RepID=UPI002B4873F1|nr:apolipoprotein N-acyltransferase [Geomonas sp.]HJV33726.1 apolipoprotein N-acyltransferase [Geomonas sp.]
MQPALKKNSILPWAAAVLGGIFLFLGYVGFDQFYLEWVFLVPVLWAIRDQRPGRAFLIGWLAGIVGHTGGFYWIVEMFRQFAGAPWPIGVLALLLLAAANGVIFATWAWGTRLIVGATGWSVVWVAPVLWTALEKLWPELFPNYLGASQYKLSLLTQIADLTGILGVSFLVVYVNATIYAVAASWFASRRLPWRTVAIFAITMVAVLGYGGFRIREVEREMAAASKMTVGLIQTNRGAADNYLEPEAKLREYQELSRKVAVERSPDLIVWPEGVCLLGITTREGRLPEALTGQTGTPMLMGACLEQSGIQGKSLSNSALLTDASGRILGSYDKSILVPFGEYIPFGDLFPILYSWSPYTSRFRPGVSVEPLTLAGHPLSVSICYEDIFPAQIRKLMHGGGNNRIPEALFNLTNDSWYGNSSEPMEHLALATFRSIEHRRELVRVTNTGISAFVDPVGRITGRTGVWTREVLVGTLPLMKGKTVYYLLGDWLGWLCAAASLAGLAWAWRLTRARR